MYSSTVQALRLCTGRPAHRGSRDIALLFLEHGIGRCKGLASRPGRSLQALRFCTGRTAHRESIGIALLFLEHGIGRGKGLASRPGRSLQALRFCTGRTAHRGSIGVALLFLDHGTRRGEGSDLRPDLSSPRERLGTHCTGGWLGPRAVLDRCGMSCPHRDSNPDRPARSQALYRLRYPAYVLLR